MTVKELIEKLSTLPQNMEVATPCCNGYDVEDLNFMADRVKGVEVKSYYEVISNASGDITFSDLYIEDPNASSDTISQTTTQLVVIE